MSLLHVSYKISVPLFCNASHLGCKQQCRPWTFGYCWLPYTLGPFSVTASRPPKLDYPQSLFVCDLIAKLDLQAYNLGTSNPRHLIVLRKSPTPRNIIHMTRLSLILPSWEETDICTNNEYWGYCETCLCLQWQYVAMHNYFSEWCKDEQCVLWIA